MRMATAVSEYGNNPYITNAWIKNLENFPRDWGGEADITSDYSAEL